MKDEGGGLLWAVSKGYRHTIPRVVTQGCSTARLAVADGIFSLNLGISSSPAADSSQVLCPLGRNCFHQGNCNPRTGREPGLNPLLEDWSQWGLLSVH